MKDIRQILLYYLQKERFQYEKVFSKRQSIESMKGLFEEIEMCIKSGMNAKDVMLVINGINIDYGWKNNHNVNFDLINERINNYKPNGETNGYQAAKRFVNTILQEKI